MARLLLQQLHTQITRNERNDNKSMCAGGSLASNPSHLWGSETIPLTQNLNVFGNKGQVKDVGDKRIHSMCQLIHHAI